MANPPDLTKLSPEELLAEATRLAAENRAAVEERDKLAREKQSLTDKLANQGGNLKSELLSTKAELARVKGEVEQQAGPPRGTMVCYQGVGEPFHRPARVLSEGYTERVPTPAGMRLHAYIEIGEPPHVLHKDDDGDYFTPGHVFERDRAYHPLGVPDTWHMPEECAHKDDPSKSAFAGEEPPAFVKQQDKVRSVETP